MGYPFNKKLRGSLLSIESNSSHMKLSYFKIYRYNKFRVDAELEREEGDLVVAFQKWMSILEGNN